MSGLVCHRGGRGPAVVLLHGSGPGASGWSNFQPNLPALSQRFRAIAVDMPGWGASDSPAPEERNHVQTLVEILDERGVCAVPAREESVAHRLVAFHVRVPPAQVDCD